MLERTFEDYVCVREFSLFSFVCTHPPHAKSGKNALTTTAYNSCQPYSEKTTTQQGFDKLNGKRKCHSVSGARL